MWQQSWLYPGITLLHDGLGEGPPLDVFSKKHWALGKTSSLWNFRVALGRRSQGLGQGAGPCGFVSPCQGLSQDNILLSTTNLVCPQPLFIVSESSFSVLDLNSSGRLENS